VNHTTETLATFDTSLGPLRRRHTGGRVGRRGVSARFAGEVCDGVARSVRSWLTAIFFPASWADPRFSDCWPAERHEF
jgi:hypothetical protein